MRKYAVLLMFMLIIAGCNKKSYYDFYPPENEFSTLELTPIDSDNIVEELEIEKNYKSGAQTQVYIGEPIVKRKSNKIRVQRNLSVHPESNIMLRSPDSDIRIEMDEGAVYNVRYTVPLRHKVYYVIEYTIPDTGRTYGILADNKGMVYPRVLYGDIELNKTFNVLPLNARVVFDENEVVLSKEPVENYEIIFNGVKDGNIEMIYREYAVGNMLRSSNSREISHPVNQEYISLNNLEIKLNEISDNRISFEVNEEE